ncbi:MAG: hypothetical protein ACLQVK_26265 [Acidimicrobiales bacterium]
MTFVLGTKDQNGYGVSAVGVYTFILYVNGVPAEIRSQDGTMPSGTFSDFGVGPTNATAYFTAPWQALAGAYDSSSATSNTIALPGAGVTDTGRARAVPVGPGQRGSGSGDLAK